MKNRAISEFKIQVEDEREGIRDVWRITNPAELEGKTTSVVLFLATRSMSYKKRFCKLVKIFKKIRNENYSFKKF